MEYDKKENACVPEILLFGTQPSERTDVLPETLVYRRHNAILELLARPVVVLSEAIKCNKCVNVPIRNASLKLRCFFETSLN